MPNKYFQFKQFRIDQALSGMKVTTDACLFGAWVANQLRCENKKHQRILDIGTGTGLLSLMLSQQIDECQIEAIEVNKEAYEEAKNNFLHSPWSDTLSCKHVPVQELDADPYDVIICNPPFFQSSSQGENRSKNQALHSSLLPMEELLHRVETLLADKGHFYLLYPEYEMNKFMELTAKSKLTLTHLIAVRNNSSDQILRKIGVFCFKQSHVEEDEIIIRGEDGKYSNEFWHLLKDYYLEYNNPEKQ